MKKAAKSPYPNSFLFGLQIVFKNVPIAIRAPFSWCEYRVELWRLKIDFWFQTYWT